MEEVKMLAPSNCTGMTAISKRKRSDSTTDAPPSTKLCTESTRPVPAIAQDPVSPTPSNPSVATRPPAQVAVAGVARLRETISAQLGLEVLLKHNELRLIDQEIAKCQVALEQLRRCGEIPYPGSQGSWSTDVSSGTGASLLGPGNGSAVSPAPWGVTDGPYARHYARWLLPDPRFDGDSGMLASAAPEGRSTRGNPDVNMFAGKTRPQRGSTGAKHTALPNGFPMVKEKSGPMLIRRKSDGVLVKLVCLDCRRDNFSSTQGFINHCRIAHNRNFASHDAAAMACGQSVQVDDSGVVVGGAVEPTANPITPGHVHPLIRSELPPSKASLTQANDAVTPSKPLAAHSSLATPPATEQTRRRSAPVALPPNPAFSASPATPHLSALMKSRGAGLDMGKLVREFQQPVDLGSPSDENSDTDESQQEPDDVGARAGRQPTRMPVGQNVEPESRKAHDRTHPKDQSTPFRPPSFLDISLAGQSQSLDSQLGLGNAHLSPHTIESNQAPSLVSDDEDDYEAASDSEAPSSSEVDEEEQVFRHIQLEDDERAAAHATTEAKPGPSLASPARQPGTPVQALKRSRSKISGVPFDDDRLRFVHPDQERDRK